MNSSRLSLVLGAASVVSLIAGAATAADVELRFAHWLPPTHALAVTGFEPWAKSIEEASGGTISVAFFPAQQLGNTVDHYDMARDGIADISFVQPGLSPGRFPIIAAGDQPLLFASGAAGSAALDAWYREHGAGETADVKHCLAHIHQPGTIHSKAEIRVPEDIRGINLRPAHAAMSAYITSIGANSIPVAPPEVRDAITKGVADALTYPWNSVIQWGIDEVVTYHLDVPLYSSTFTIVMNQGSYDRLTEEQKAVIDAHCSTEWAEKIGGAWAEVDQKGRETLLSRDGHSGVEISEGELKAWIDAAEPMFENWASSVRSAGLDPEEIMNALRGEIDSRGASLF